MSTDVKTGSEWSPSSAPEAGAATDLGELSRRAFEEAFNEGKFELTDQYTAPDAVSHDPALPPGMRDMRGPELLRRLVQMYRNAFPDVRITVDEVISAADKVVLRWHSEGTHRGELEGYAPTGARGSVTGITIDHWKDGKVAESWVEWDNLGLARQIGAAPPEGSPGEKLGIRLQNLMARRMRKQNGM